MTASSDVPAAPKNIADGGKASLQPKRTPVSDKEIESIMVRYFHYKNGKKKIKRQETVLLTQLLFFCSALNLVVGRLHLTF